MAVISITTTQNIELEYELASLGERMVATIIDLVILVGYIILVQLFGTFSNGLFNSDVGWIAFFIIMLPVTFYSLLSETYFMSVKETNDVANYPEVTQLSDSDMQLVKEVLINVRRSGNAMLAVQTM